VRPKRGVVFLTPHVSVLWVVLSMGVLGAEPGAERYVMARPRDKGPIRTEQCHRGFGGTTLACMMRR
jgi:hypothetical protein